jgi:hypothetical protein
LCVVRRRAGNGEQRPKPALGERAVYDGEFAVEAFAVGACFECSRPFEIGRGARRLHSKFCSTRCKDNYHNRLKAQARRTDHA